MHKPLWNLYAAAAAAKLLQLYPTLWDPIDGSPPGYPVPGILQARTLECVAISFSNAWKWKVKVKLFSRVRLFTTPWSAAYQVPLSLGFSKQEYWSGVSLPESYYHPYFSLIKKLENFRAEMESKPTPSVYIQGNWGSDRGRELFKVT